jgi:hypothetical protein
MNWLEGLLTLGYNNFRQQKQFSLPESYNAIY